MTWQLIETLDASETRQVVFGYWVRTGERKYWVAYIREPANKPSSATHWMPLPEPPKEQP